MNERRQVERPWGVQSVLTDETASGTPLVLLHPLALAGKVWAPLLGDFGDRPSLMIDLRGHGQSQVDDPNPPPYQVCDLADDVISLLDALEISEFDLCGLSMGGSVAIFVAARAGLRLRRLVLTDTTAWYGPEAARSWAERANRAANTDRRAQLEFQLDRWFSEDFQQQDPAAVEAVCQVFVETKPTAHVQACLALGTLDARDRLGEITAETLVVTGERDFATPPTMGGALATGIGGAEFRVWPGVRHFGSFESAGLRHAVRDFLDD